MNLGVQNDKTHFQKTIQTVTFSSIILVVRIEGRSKYYEIAAVLRKKHIMVSERYTAVIQRDCNMIFIKLPPNILFISMTWITTFFEVCLFASAVFHEAVFFNTKNLNFRP